MAVAFVVALFVMGCGDRPTLTNDDVAELKFSVFSGSSSPSTRIATAREVERFVRAYARAQDHESPGTTHPVRVDVLLKSGSSFIVWGGALGFQTVLDGERQWRIRSADLDRMLRAIAGI